MDHEHHHHEHLESEYCPSCSVESMGDIKVGRKLKIFGIIFIAVYALSWLPFLQPLQESFASYLKLIWWAVLLGLLIGGVIEYFIPESLIYKYLGRRKKRTLFFAVIAGFLMSACSHGILALSIQLYKKGASIPAVITFLLASPWANLPLTILLISFFGAQGILFVLAAMLIALITGFTFMGLDKLGWIESSMTIDKKQLDSGESHKHKDRGVKGVLLGVISGAVNLANMVLWWILIGFLLAVVIRAYVPHHIFLRYFNASFTGLLLTLAFATIIEVCSEGSAPIAFEVFNKVGKLGNPFVFLMAGVVTDYTEIGLLWSNIGKRTAVWLPIISVPQVLLIGYLFNLLL